MTGRRPGRRPVHAAEVVRTRRAADRVDDQLLPVVAGQCSANLGNNVKVNQNCLNLTDPNLQGRGQANNEPSISRRPVRLAATSSPATTTTSAATEPAASYFSQNGGRTWANTTIPNGFTAAPCGFAREYWQAGGDTSVAWDTRGNAYMSCQLFNRGTVASPNPDQSSTFVVFRATQNGGASWNFPGRYSATFTFDPTGTARRAAGQGADGDRRQRPAARTATASTSRGPSSPPTARPTSTRSTRATTARRSATRCWSARTARPARTRSACRRPSGQCNENQFSDPFVGPDGSLYVAWDNFNNQPTSGTDNHYQVLLAKSTDGGQTFSAPGQGQRLLRPARLRHLPGCRRRSGAVVRAGEGLVDEVGVPRDELPVGRGRSEQPERRRGRRSARTSTRTRTSPTDARRPGSRRRRATRPTPGSRRRGRAPTRSC